MPELSLADALGAVGKPIHRVHTAGSVGASTAITGVHAGRVGPCTTACSSSATRSSPRATPRGRSSGGRSRWPGRGRHVRAVDPQLHLAVGRARAHRLEGRGEGPAERAQESRTRTCTSTDISIEKVKESPMLWDPLHFLESCPSSDGAAAIVLGSEEVAKRGAATPAWVIAHAKRTEFGPFPGRDTVRAAGRRRLRGGALQARPASPTRCGRSTAPSSTCRSAGTSRCGSRAT